MGVTITPAVIVGGDTKAWVCRAGREHRRYGDRYTLSCYITRQQGHIAVVEALSGADLTKSELDELKRLLRREGFTAIHWDRIRVDGSVHCAVISLLR